MVTIPPSMAIGFGKFPKQKYAPKRTNNPLVLLIIAFIDKGIYCRARQPDITVMNGPNIDPIMMLVNAEVGIEIEYELILKAKTEKVSKKIVRFSEKITGDILFIYFLMITALQAPTILEYKTY